jgi:hypothetical protein
MPKHNYNQRFITEELRTFMEIRGALLEMIEFCRPGTITSEGFGEWVSANN